MRERPILFQGAMVRAILAGEKTQTRRVVKNDREGLLDCEPTPAWDAFWQCVPCPYGVPGDQLWVRESHWWFKDQHDPVTGYFPPKLTAEDVEYRADGDDGRKVWRPSIHMPRWASRIQLEITGVRVEHLQDINENDAEAEGVSEWARGALSPEGQTADASDQYRWLWEAINGPDSWSANPWVWVVEFRRIKP